MKAFEEQLLLQHLPSGQIKSIASHDEKLYIGTSDGNLLLYKLEKSQVTFADQTSYETYLEQKRNLGHGKKTVDQLHFVGELDQILVLCDGNLSMHDGATLEPTNGIATPMKGVSRFCTDTKGPLYRLCVATKKRLQLYEFVGNYVLYKELAIPDQVLALAWHGNVIAIGYKKEYNLLNLDVGKPVAVFPIEKSQKTCLIKLLPGEEVLISLLVGEENLGLFVDLHGTAKRQNLRWSQPPLQVAFRLPYVISLLPKCIEVHNLYDQTLLQTIPVLQCTLMEQNGHIFAGSPSKLSIIVPTAADRQIADLLKSRRIQEAIDLVTRSEHKNPEELHSKLQGLYKQAGFVLLEDLDFKEAAKYFMDSDVDIRDLLVLFPSVLSEDICKQHTPQHPYDPNITVSGLVLKKAQAKGQPVPSNDTVVLQVRAAKTAFVPFIEFKRSLLTDMTRIIDTALVKLYVDVDEKKAKEFLKDRNDCDTEDCLKYLKEKGKHNATAFLHANKNQPRLALDIWQKLGSGLLQDGTCDGVKETMDFLSTTEDSDLVWEYAPWILRREPNEGVKIFTSSTPLRLEPDKVLSFLAPYGESLSITYLEFLVGEGGVEEEQYHTKLALRHLETVIMLMPSETLGLTKRLKPGSEAGLLGQVRAKLIEFLSTSKFYSVPTILGRVRDSSLHYECAMLYGKLGQHELALRRLVYYLKDFEEAERYCHDYNETVESTQEQEGDLFVTLLDVCLHPPGGTPLSDEMMKYASQLLDERWEHLAPVKVLGLLPSSLPLSSISDYLSAALPSRLHTLRDGQIMKNIARQESLQARCQLISETQCSVVVSKDLLCPVCQKRIVDKIFARFPNGVVVHFNCLSKTEDGERDRYVDPISHTDLREVND